MDNLTTMDVVDITETSPDPMRNLLPALLQIFTTIGLGWAAGALGIFQAKEARGIGMFVGKISLPTLILTNLITLDLSDIKWSFLLAVFAAKSIVFIFVLLLDFILNRDISRASIFAIYSTQTNDFGMGLPILTTVFGAQHPMVSLLYLVAPISLLILNPIAFILLELGREKRAKDEGLVSTVLTVVRGLLTNPVIAMTVLGVLGNLVLSSSMPPLLDHFLSALGATFTALAPFSLGLSMVGRLGAIRGATIKPILALVAVKMIVTPRITYLLVDQAMIWLEGSPDASLSNFAFLLGSFPTALGVASYAVDYQVCPDLVSAAIVLGTLVSAPIMYGTANILTTLSQTSEVLTEVEHSCTRNCCIISIISVAIVLGLFLYRRGWRALHLHTAVMLLLTLISSTAGLLHMLLPHPALALTHLTALHASRLATPALALHILLLVRGSTPSTTTTALLLLSGPLLSLTTLVLLLFPYTPDHFLPFGETQDLVSLALHLLALLPTTSLLFLSSRRQQPQLPGHQVFRHTLLLLLLTTTMFTSVALSLCHLFLSQPSYPGVFKVLIVCNCIFTSGQGLVFLLVFGSEHAAALLAHLQLVLRRLVGGWSGRRESLVNTFIMVASESTERLMGTPRPGGQRKVTKAGLEV